MPKRKAPQKVPDHNWITGQEPIGEIVMQIAEQIAIEAEQHRQAGEVNQLARHELDRRRAEAVRQINRAFAYKLETEIRQTNAAKPQKESAQITRNSIVKCFMAVSDRGERVTADAIAREWRIGQKWQTIPPALRTIRKYLRELREDSP